jgi:hypothetical protein
VFRKKSRNSLRALSSHLHLAEWANYEMYASKISISGLTLLWRLIFYFIIFTGSSVDSQSECYPLFSDVWSIFNQCEESNIRLLSAASTILNISKERSRGNLTGNYRRNNVFNSFFTSKLSNDLWFFLSQNVIK